MDLGHGKLRIACSSTSATMSAAGRPGFSITAKRILPFCVVAFLKLVAGQPAPRKNPSIAFSGASALGPLRSSRSRAGIQHALDGQRQAARRRKGSGRGIGQARLDQAVRDQFLQVSRRVACIRAGISSEKSSIRRSGISSVPFWGCGHSPMMVPS